MDRLPKKDWTVLVYQGGVNNLDSSLQGNLKELTEGPHPANVDVLVRQIDAAGQMRDFQVDSRGLRALNEPVADVDSADPARLAEFLARGIKAYPAQHYLLVVSSHGRGAEGLIEDERKGTLVSPAELAGALEVGRQANGGRPLDMVFFDACRMMALEVASEIHGCVDVAVGSMDRIGSEGYDPAVLIRQVSHSRDALALAQGLVAQQGERQLGAFGSMSALDLKKIDELVSSVAVLAKEMAGLDEGTARQVRHIATHTRRSLPSPTYLDGLDNMAYSISLHPNDVGEELKDWLSMTRPTDPVALFSLCQNLLADPTLAATQPALMKAARGVAEAEQSAVLAQRGEALSVLLPIERDHDTAPPQLAFENFTHWNEAVTHIVPTGSPAVLPKTWLEEKLDRPRS